MTRTTLRLAGGAALLLLLAGCGQTVEEGDLVDQVGSVVETSYGEAPDSVDCPDPLDAEEGATTTCEVTVGDETYDVDAEVTGVDGDRAEFDVTVPEELRVPMVAADEVGAQIASQVEQQVGATPDSVECPDDLRGVPDETMTCLLSIDGQEFDTEVTVTSVEGTQVNFDFQVAEEPNA